MPYMDKHKSGVDGLKDELYSSKHQGPMEDVRAPLSESDAHVPVVWPSAETTEGQGGMLPQSPAQPADAPKHVVGMSYSTKFFLGSLAFFVVAAGAAVYFFFGNGNFVSPNNIDLEIVAPSLVDGGAQVDLQVIATNRNSSALKLVDLVLTYPAGTRVAEDPNKPLQTERQSIGTIASGQSIKRTASAIFYGQEGSTQQVHVQLEYTIEGSNAVFVREGDVSITIGSSPVSISVKAPTNITAGQLFSIDVTVQSNSKETVSDVALEAQYPFGFSVKSASPRADSGTGLWHLGTMAPGTTKVISITGTIDGQDGDERVFRFLAGSEADQTAARIKVPFLNVPTSISVSRPFISGTLTVAGKTGSTISVSPGQTIQGSVAWQNNLADPVSNIEVELKLSGPVLDAGSVQSPNGFYQSQDKTIRWTSAEDPSLAQVAASGQGTLTFSFATLPPGDGGVVYTNPKVTLTLSIKGTRGSDQSAESVSAADTIEVVLGSLLTLEAQSNFNQGAYSNLGPTPPRAEQETTYTIAWTAKNSSNAIANANVTAVLPSYVTYKTGQAGITYDVASRAVRWDLGELKAGVGYTSAAKTASFQVAITPSISQVGQAPALTGAAVLFGTDRFAQIQVQSQAPGPTTATADGKNGTVQAK